MRQRARLSILSFTLLGCFLCSASLGAAVRVESNVMFGMYSGLALLMDVITPSSRTDMASSLSQEAAGTPL